MDRRKVTELMGLPADTPDEVIFARADEIRRRRELQNMKASAARVSQIAARLDEKDAAKEQAIHDLAMARYFPGARARRHGALPKESPPPARVAAAAPTAVEARALVAADDSAAADFAALFPVEAARAARRGSSRIHRDVVA